MLVHNKTLIRAHRKKAKSKNTVEGLSLKIRHDTDIWTE